MRTCYALLLIFLLGACTSHPNEAIFDAIRDRDFKKAQSLLSSDSSLSGIKNAQGETPLHLAVKMGEDELIQLFVEKKWNLNIQDYQGNTPLILATTYGYYNMVKSLIKAKADLTIVNNHGANAAKVALEMNKPEILMLFLAEGMVKDDYYPKLVATKYAQQTTVIPFGDMENKILYAIQNNDLQLFKDILDNETHPVHYTAQDNRGKTLLHTVAALSNPEYLKYYLFKDRSALDMKDKEGVNPLMEAIYSKNLENIRELVLAGANLRTTDKDFKNILDYAVLTADLPTFNLIINNFRSLNDQDIQGNTPVHYAAQILESTDILTTLLETGAASNIENKVARDTPLHIAVKAGNLEAVKVLLKFGANPSIQNAEGKTAKDIAIGTKIEGAFL